MPDQSNLPIQALEARIDTLEMRIAYQDDVIDQLNQAIIAQWAKLDQTKAQLERLESRLRDAQDNAGTGPADTFNNQPPPHW